MGTRIKLIGKQFIDGRKSILHTGTYSIKISKRFSNKPILTVLWRMDGCGAIEIIASFTHFVYSTEKWFENVLRHWSSNQTTHIKWLFTMQNSFVWFIFSPVTHCSICRNFIAHLMGQSKQIANLFFGFLFRSALSLSLSSHSHTRYHIPDITISSCLFVKQFDFRSSPPPSRITTFLLLLLLVILFLF